MKQQKHISDIAHICKNRVLVYSLLFFTAISFLLVFSIYTSPLYRQYCGWDSSFFMTVGRAMQKGKLPYQDFFDCKGPIIFILNWCGQLVISGRLGIFLLQIPFLWITLILIYETVLLFQRPYAAIVSILFFFFILASTMEGGNLTEEYCLPFIALSLFLTMRHLQQQCTAHPPKFAVIHGICFGFCAFCRITNGITIAGCVLLLSCVLLINRQWKSLWQNALGFIGGLLIVALPLCIYFATKGLLFDMLYCTFIFPYFYAVEGSATRTASSWQELFYKMTPVLICLAAGFYNLFFQKNKFLTTLLFLLTAFNCGILFLGKSYFHYFTILAPLAAISLALFPISREFFGSLKNRAAKVGLLIVTVMFLSPCLYQYYNSGITVARDNYRLLRYANNGSRFNEMQAFSANIPENERESIFVYTPYWMDVWAMDIVPVCRYNGWQEHYIELDPSIGDEIDTFLQEEHPLWILVWDEASIQNQRFLTRLNDDYQFMDSLRQVKMYRLKT